MNSKCERFHGSALFSPSPRYGGTTGLEPGLSGAPCFPAGGDLRCRGHQWAQQPRGSAHSYEVHLGWSRWEGLACLLRGRWFLKCCPLSVWAPRNFIIRKPALPMMLICTSVHPPRENSLSTLLNSSEFVVVGFYPRTQQRSNWFNSFFALATESIGPNLLPFVASVRDFRDWALWTIVSLGSIFFFLPWFSFILLSVVYFIHYHKSFFGEGYIYIIGNLICTSESPHFTDLNLEDIRDLLRVLQAYVSSLPSEVLLLNCRSSSWWTWPSD